MGSNIIKVVYLNGIPRIGVISCTEEEFEYYKKNSRMNTDNYLQTDFLKKYLLDKANAVFKEEQYSTEGLSIGGERYMLESGSSRFITVSDVKHALQEHNLTYEEFIDAYCKFLKTL